jgi:hypothetical protein
MSRSHSKVNSHARENLSFGIKFCLQVQKINGSVAERETRVHRLNLVGRVILADLFIAAYSILHERNRGNLDYAFFRTA